MEYIETRHRLGTISFLFELPTTRPVLITFSLVTDPWICQALHATNFTPCCSNGLTAYTTRGSGCESNTIGLCIFLEITCRSANYNSQVNCIRSKLGRVFPISAKYHSASFERSDCGGIFQHPPGIQHGMPVINSYCPDTWHGRRV